MRYTPAYPQVALQGMLDPARVMRWVWVGRATLACAILAAAVFVWNRAEPLDTLVATLAFAGTTIFTVGSVVYAELQRRPRGALFHGVQCVVDLLLVTAVVHLTGGWSSQFAALYILVIASSALLLPLRAGLVVAAGACVLYIADVLWLRTGGAHIGVLVQTGVFVIVALGAGFVVQRLRLAGVGRETLAKQLVKVQLEAADILRTIRSGIMTIDGQGRLLYANPAASELLGLNLRHFVGRPVLGTLVSKAPQLAMLLEQTSRDGIRTTRAEGVIHRDGGEVEIGVTTTLAEPGDEPAGARATATAIFQDISDSKRLQALHIRAERLQAVAELSASLAHEIRNPLASIRSASEQLARRRSRAMPLLSTDEEDDERILHGLVMREADRLSRLLSDFLDFARARVTRVASLDLGTVARTTITLLRAHPSAGSGIEIAVEVDPDLPRVDGDEDLVHRAIFNLLLNAAQAVGERGRIGVRVAHGTADEFRRAHGEAAAFDAVSVSVTDDGPGVPMELRTTLFEPFVTGKTGGTGLGLPVVHRAAEAHGGVVLYDALPDGTRFTLLLPLQAPGSPAPAPDYDDDGDHEIFGSVAGAGVADDSLAVPDRVSRLIGAPS